MGEWMAGWMSVNNGCLARCMNGLMNECLGE
jgi:hypothetical protein